MMFVILPPIIGCPTISFIQPRTSCSMISLKAPLKALMVASMVALIMVPMMAPMMAPLAVSLEGCTMSCLEGHITSLRRVCQTHLATKRDFTIFQRETGDLKGAEVTKRGQINSTCHPIFSHLVVTFQVERTTIGRG